jgi:hypothetical protein
MFPIEGVRPISPTVRPNMRPNVPCELQEPPDLNAAMGAPAETPVSPVARVSDSGTGVSDRKVRFEWNKVVDHMRRTARGLRTFDPLVYEGSEERRMLRELKLFRRSDGRLAERPQAEESK